MSTQQADRFIYVVGEQQNAIIQESPETFDFTRNNMQQIQTEELASVIANVFARGQFFPGPEGVLTSVIHEFTSRADLFKNTTLAADQGQCTFITAFKRLDGEISVKVAAIIPAGSNTLKLEEPDGFHELLLESLPDFQQVFTEEAYATDSKLIDIIGETTLHHLNKKFN